MVLQTTRSFSGAVYLIEKVISFCDSQRFINLITSSKSLLRFLDRYKYFVVRRSFEKQVVPVDFLNLESQESDCKDVRKSVNFGFLFTREIDELLSKLVERKLLLEITKKELELSVLFSRVVFENALFMRVEKTREQDLLHALREHNVVNDSLAEFPEKQSNLFAMRIQLNMIQRRRDLAERLAYNLAITGALEQKKRHNFRGNNEHMKNMFRIIFSDDMFDACQGCSNGRTILQTLSSNMVVLVSESFCGANSEERYSAVLNRYFSCMCRPWTRENDRFDSFLRSIYSRDNFSDVFVILIQESSDVGYQVHSHNTQSVRIIGKSKRDCYVSAEAARFIVDKSRSTKELRMERGKNRSRTTLYKRGPKSIFRNKILLETFLLGICF